MKKKNKLNKKIRRSLIIISILLVILFILIGVYLKNIEKNDRVFYEKSKTILLESKQVEDVSKSYYFQDKELIHIHQGKQNAKVSLYFIDVDKEKVIDQTLISDVYPEETLKEKVSQFCEDCRFISIQPAYLDSKKVYEVKYKDNATRYVYDYYDLMTGEHVETLKLNQKFN